MATMDEKRPPATPEASQAPVSDGTRGARRRRRFATGDRIVIGDAQHGHTGRGRQGDQF